MVTEKDCKILVLGITLRLTGVGYWSEDSDREAECLRQSIEAGSSGLSIFISD